MNVEEKRVLLPKSLHGDEYDGAYKYDGQHDDNSWNAAKNKLYIKIVMATFLAIVSLLAVSCITPNVENEKITTTSLKFAVDAHQSLSMPSSYPTIAPSNLYVDQNCNPHDPPCAERLLGICTRHYHCHQVKEPCEDNEDDDDAAHIRNGDCDPEDPPCLPGKLFLGICWEYEKCLEVNPGNSSTSPQTNRTRSEYENESSASSPSGGERTYDASNRHPRNSTTSGNKDVSGENPSSGSEDGTKPTNEGNVTEPERNGPDSADKSKEMYGDDFFDFKWIEFNISIPFIGELTSQPTLEPTQIHACDPSNPPCSKYEFGTCVEYETCFGVHSTPHNTTREEFNDDEGFTFEPTHMPVPNPTFQPTEQPTSTPTTTMPTPAGYTFQPSISMMPTAVETFHPTAYVLCDPQNPPCDHYFFGACLGLRYCSGSHEPTPMPTSVPAMKNMTSSEVQKHI